MALLVLGAAGACSSEATPPAASSSSGLDWRRVNLGFVSAYVLVRDGGTAIVDTGVEGSADAIGEVLTTADRDWSDVAHVLLTHRHGDHVGSLDAVLERAGEAQVYAGEQDIEAIASSRPITAVGDGEEVFGLQVVATPGHTPGHVSFLLPGRLLLAGDALNGEDGGVVGPNPQFTADMQEAMRSVGTLAELDFDTVVFGHGDPVEGDAAAQVAALTRDA